MDDWPRRADRPPAPGAAVVAGAVPAHLRDDTGLTVNPHLWASIVTAMDDSAYFVLMASPEAAASPWVNREIEHWCATKSPDHILPVLTEGTLAWDNARSFCG